MKNVVAEAMAALGGQLEDVAVVCRVSASAVWKWLKKGQVSDARCAVLIARACAERGHTKITVARLAGLDEDESGKSLGPSISRKQPQEAAA